MSQKLATVVYVNQINLNKLKLCIQNQKPCMMNVNTIQRKGAVRTDVLLTRKQVKILNDTGSLKIKMSKPMLNKSILIRGNMSVCQGVVSIHPKLLNLAA